MHHDTNARAPTHTTSDLLQEFEIRLERLDAHLAAIDKVPTSVQAGCLRLDARNLHAGLRTEVRADLCVGSPLIGVKL